MTSEGFAPMCREEIEACLALASSKVTAHQWTNDHSPHTLREPVVENLIFKGVRVTFRCSCGETLEAWI
jgi:hypothetical protein